MRLAVLVLAGFSGAAAICGLLWPINSTTFRLLTLAAWVVFLGAVFVLMGARSKLRWALLGGLVVVAGAVLLAPARKPETEKLRAVYVQALGNYRGVSYVWGGEGRMGIDCSGLPRKALRDALFREGVRTLNGGLVREAIRQWWRDASAQALSEGYMGYMIPLFSAKALRSADFSTLRPGDVAITSSGVHCLVYEAGNQWIQADPGVGSVAEFDARATENSWFDTPVTVFRWSILQ